MQLIIFNEITFQKNLVGLYTNIKSVGVPIAGAKRANGSTSSWYRIIDYSERISQTKGKNSQSKKNSISSEVTSTEDSRDDFPRLTSAVGMPTVDKQQKNQEKKQEDQNIQSEVDNWEENADLDDSEENDE